MQFTTELRLPPDASSKFIEESRSRLVLPRTWSPNHGSRLILRLILLAHRGVAFDFLAIFLGSCLHPLLVLGAAPTSRGRKEVDTPQRGTIEDEEGGYRGYGINILGDTRAYESEQS